MGHYREKNIKLTIDFAELVAAGNIIYEMVLDSRTGSWVIVTKQDSDGNVIDAAEFTQKAAPVEKA